jgi:hypothetical protein
MKKKVVQVDKLIKLFDDVQSGDIWTHPTVPRGPTTAENLERMKRAEKVKANWLKKKTKRQWYRP